MSEAEKEKFPETLHKIRIAEEQLEKIASRSQFKGITTTSTIVYGAPYAEIVAFAKKSKADIIVIGSHGNEGSERYYIGSNIQKVLREAECPVLAIKKDSPLKNWKKMVFATNLDEKISKPFLQISKIAKALNLTINLVIVNSPEKFMTTREAIKKMDDFSSKHPGLKFTNSLYCHTSIEEGILEFAEDIGADWITMCTHGKLSKPGYLIGNTEALVYRSPIPVMSVRILNK